MTTNIIVTTMNYLPYTKLCVKSILENTYAPYKLIFVDDGSKDGTVDWLKQNAEDAIILQNDTGKPRGWWGANNLGVSYEEADYYALVDRDMVFTPYWLKKITWLLNHKPKIGIISPFMNCGIGEQAVPQGGPIDPKNIVQDFFSRYPELYKINYDAFFLRFGFTYDVIQEFGRLVEKRYTRRYIYQAPLMFHCAVMRKSTVEKVGLFDAENFFWADGDMDYSYRCLKAGVLLAVRLDAYVHHQWIAEGIPAGHRGSNHYSPYYLRLNDWKRKYGTESSAILPNGEKWNSFLPCKRIIEFK